jgi:hypothetical protein
MSTETPQGEKPTDRIELERETSVGYKRRPSLLLAADPDDVLPTGDNA